jgi:hypothetical protein
VTGTGRAVVAGQARAIADAWSSPGAPESWWLTAAMFAAVAEEDVLLDLAAAIPADRTASASTSSSVRGGLLDVLPDVVAAIPPDLLVCLVDTYVHVFLPPDDLARFDRLLGELGRDVEWVSVDPLAPLGPDARRTVQGLDVPAEWVRDNRDGGVFGVIGRVSVRNGVRSGRVLGRAHPGAAWLEWC